MPNVAVCSTKHLNQTSPISSCIISLQLGAMLTFEHALVSKRKPGTPHNRTTGGASNEHSTHVHTRYSRGWPVAATLYGSYSRIVAVNIRNGVRRAEQRRPRNADDVTSSVLPCSLSLTRVTKSYLLALGTTQISSF